MSNYDRDYERDSNKTH